MKSKVFTDAEEAALEEIKVCMDSSTIGIILAANPDTALLPNKWA